MADTALTEAAKNGEVPKILNLLRQGGDVNERDSGGQTALMFAARNGHLEAVRLLLEKGAGVDLKRASDGRTALHFAAWHGHVEVAKKLIKAGASVDLKKNDGWTALHLAANHGHAEVAKDLLRAGASTVIRNKHNRTALDVANQKNNEEVASILRASQRWRKGAQVPSVEATRRDVPLEGLKSKEASQQEPNLPSSHGSSSAFPLEDNYEKDSFLGRGMYGEVYKYNRTSDRYEVRGSLHQALPVQVAVKKVTKAGIDKPGDKKNRTVWLAMELCHWSLGDLIKRKRDLKWIPVSSLMRQIAQALKYMHGKKIAHRDLKPENILLKYNEAGVSASRDLSTVDVVSGLTVKVSDFGFSRLVPVDSHTLSLLGTLLYMAPEVTENQGRYGTKVDLYSLGVVAYELATGQTAGLKTDLENRWAGLDFNAHFKDALDKMLQADPEDRIGANELLSHPFLFI